MKFIVPNILFVFLLGVLTVWLTFLTTKGSLTNNSYKSLAKKLTLRGKIVMSVFIAIISLLVWQEINIQNQNYNQNLLLEKERETRDAKITVGIKKGVDSISTKLFNDISVAFLKQELKLDTLNQEIVNIKNTTPRINYSGASPIIYIDSSGISLEQEVGALKKYKLRIKVADAGAANFEIKCGVLDAYKDESYSFQWIDFFPKEIKLFKNSQWTTGFTTIINKESNDLFIYLKGTYFSVDGLQEYSINDLYSYNPIEGVRTPLNIRRNKMIEIINKIPADGTVVKF